MPWLRSHEPSFVSVVRTVATGPSPWFHVRAVPELTFVERALRQGPFGLRYYVLGCHVRAVVGVVGLVDALVAIGCDGDEHVLHVHFLDLEANVTLTSGQLVGAHLEGVLF